MIFQESTLPYEDIAIRHWIFNCDVLTRVIIPINMRPHRHNFVTSFMSINRVTCRQLPQHLPSCPYLVSLFSLPYAPFNTLVKFHHVSCWVVSWSHPFLVGSITMSWLLYHWVHLIMPVMPMFHFMKIATIWPFRKSVKVSTSVCILSRDGQKIVNSFSLINLQAATTCHDCHFV